MVLILQSSALGGMESHCIELAGELVRRGAMVQAIVPEADAFGPLAIALHERGARVERIDTDARRGRLSQLLAMVRLVRQLRSFAPQVVHLHFGGATGGLAAAVMARLATRSVVVVTEHDVPSATPGPLQRINRHLLDRVVHVLVMVSRYNAQLRLQRIGAPTRKLAVVLNGVRVPAASPSLSTLHRAQVRLNLGLDADTPVIGSVVRLVPGKGLPTILKAFATVRRQHDARLLLVGGGPLEADLRMSVRDLGIQDAVVMTGHQRDPGSFVHAMDVFVLAVPVGSGSIALLEAMARGKASLITFGNGEEPVVPEQTGIWAPSDDANALAAAMLRLCSDPDLRERLGRAAAKHVRKHFTVQRMADDLIDVYLAARDDCVPAGLRFTDPSDQWPGSRRPRRVSP